MKKAETATHNVSRDSSAADYGTFLNLYQPYHHHDDVQASHPYHHHHHHHDVDEPDDSLVLYEQPAHF